MNIDGHPRKSISTNIYVHPRTSSNIYEHLRKSKKQISSINEHLRESMKIYGHPWKSIFANIYDHVWREPPEPASWLAGIIREAGLCFPPCQMHTRDRPVRSNQRLRIHTLKKSGGVFLGRPIWKWHFFIIYDKKFPGSGPPALQFLSFGMTVAILAQVQSSHLASCIRRR